MRPAIMQPLSIVATHWTGRSHYHIDTAALLLAGADPASIDTKGPENVTVGEAWAVRAFATGSKVWRARLASAALAGDLAMSIDGESGTVGVWGDSGRWAPMAVDEAAQLVGAFELRERDVFFDIDREELARWLLKEGVKLPFWLDAEPAPASSGDCGRWWYVVPLRWALAAGQPVAPDGRTLLADIARNMAMVQGLKDLTPPKPHATAQRGAAQAAIQRQPVNMDGEKVPNQSHKVVAGLWAYAAHLAKTDITDAEALAAALKNAGLPCPSSEQLMRITEL